MTNQQRAETFLERLDTGIRLLRVAGAIDMRQMILVLEVLRISMSRQRPFSMRAIYSIINKH